MALSEAGLEAHSEHSSHIREEDFVLKRNTRDEEKENKVQKKTTVTKNEEEMHRRKNYDVSSESVLQYSVPSRRFYLTN
jgi:hypothetical protein